MRRFGGSDSHASIEDYRAALENQKRVAVEFSDLGKIFNHRAHSQQSILQCCSIARGASSKSRKKRIGLEASNHLAGVVLSKRCQTNRHVAHQFYKDPARTARHDGTKLRIVSDADNHLYTSGDHSLNHKGGR